MEELESALKLVSTHGLSVVLAVVLLWNLLRRDRDRDNEMRSLRSEVTQIRSSDRQEMLNAINGCAGAIDKFAAAFDRFSDMLDDWRQTRACLWTNDQLRAIRHGRHDEGDLHVAP